MVFQKMKYGIDNPFTQRMELERLRAELNAFWIRGAPNLDIVLMCTERIKNLESILDST